MIPLVADTVEARASWAGALDLVLADEAQPGLVAQPIVDIAGARIAGYELLARFAGSVVAPPDVWFAEADRRGVSALLAGRVIVAALRMRSSVPVDRFVTVNIEPHLLTAPEVQRAFATASGNGLRGLVVELTEHTLPTDEARFLAALAEVRAAGALVAVDDAGTGYAGLSQLLLVRPDIIKLDRALVAGLQDDPVRRALVEMLGSFAGRMDSWLLAEGVETADELAVLADLQVPLAQGWLLGRPAAPWAELAADVSRTLTAALARSSLTEHLAPLVRSCVQTNDATGGAVGTVLLSREGQPQGLWVLDVDGRAVLAPVMVVAPSTAVADAARRAMARPAQHRHVPLVCTDGRGRVVGLVDIGSLVEALASGAPLEAPTTADPAPPVHAQGQET